jgi:hypothetical protein
MRRRKTSREAWDSTQPYRRERTRKVFNAIKAAGERGLTGDEIEVQERILHQSLGSVLVELSDVRAIIDSGRKRATRTGRSAIVWIAGTSAARAAEAVPTQGRLF